MANRCADAVVASVAAADDDDSLVTSINGRLLVAFAGLAPSSINFPGVKDRLGVPVQELHGQMHTLELPSRHLAHVPRQCGSRGQQHRIIVGKQFLRCGPAILAHSSGLAAYEGHALLGHDIRPPLYHVDLVSLHVWHAIHHEAAQAIRALVHRHPMAHPVELICCRKARWPRAYDGHAFAGACRWRPRLHPAIAVRLIDDEQLY
mmetsp:Transcript_69333/g.160623  ORF Transcript_69333/g.160623 Transcript_69333/m.160623 type:complete len:205 (+) Transcript_69333:458-1072(+)